MTQWFTDSVLGDDMTGTGAAEYPFRTMQRAVPLCATDDEIVLAAEAYPAEDFDFSVAPAGTTRIRITANYYSVATIRRIKPGVVGLSVLVQNGEWFWGDPASPAASLFTPRSRSFLFDNATVHIGRYSLHPQVFYHCDILVNAIFPAHIFISSRIRFGSDAYWYNQIYFYYYYCNIVVPDGMDDVQVPIYDQIGFGDLLSDMLRRDYLKPRNSKPSFIQRTLATEHLYTPFTSINGPTVSEGPDLAAKNGDGYYTDDDWAFLLGEYLPSFRGQLSLGTRNGSGRSNVIVWTPNTQKQYGEYVYPTSSTGFYYKCIVAGITGSVEPSPWPIIIGNTMVDGGVTWSCINPSDVPADLNASAYRAPNFFERYIKNLFSDAYIMQEKLLNLQGILNSRYGAEGFAGLYEMIGMDVKAMLAYNLADMWCVAGSIVGLLNMLECDRCGAGVWEFNKRRNFPIGRLPFYYDTATEKFVFHRRVTNWWDPATVRQPWKANEVVRIGTLIWVPYGGADPLLAGTYFEFECTGEGSAPHQTGAVLPFGASSFDLLEYTTDGDITWRCFGQVADDDVAATPYNTRAIRGAHDYIRHYFDYDYTMEIVRQKNEQAISPTVGWNYIYFNPVTEAYSIMLPSASLALSSHFDQYISDIRAADREPIAFALMEMSGMSMVVKQIILLQGGVVGYNRAYSPVPSMFVVQPNNTFSYESLSRGGIVTTDKNSIRDDAILANIFRQTFALDTELYRQAFVNEWEANRSVAIGALVRPTNPGLLAETYAYVCTVAGTTGAVEPAVWNATPGGLTVDGTATWLNIGYFKLSSMQIENP